MNNVVSLRSANSSASAKEDRFIEDLRGLVWSDERVNKRTWEQLAVDANLSYSTVRNFASGTTKRPHMTTIDKLIGAMGFRFAIVPSKTRRLPQEIDLRSFRSRKRA